MQGIRDPFREVLPFSYMGFGCTFCAAISSEAGSHVSMPPLRILALKSFWTRIRYAR
jgi:hypothetical protein